MKMLRQENKTNSKWIIKCINIRPSKNKMAANQKQHPMTGILDSQHKHYIYINILKNKQNKK